MFTSKNFSETFFYYFPRSLPSLQKVLRVYSKIVGPECKGDVGYNHDEDANETDIFFSLLFNAFFVRIVYTYEGGESRPAQKDPT